jgi:hypothetical protein
MDLEDSVCVQEIPERVPTTLANLEALYNQEVKAKQTCKLLETEILPSPPAHTPL